MKLVHTHSSYPIKNYIAPYCGPTLYHGRSIFGKHQMHIPEVPSELHSGYACTRQHALSFFTSKIIYNNLNSFLFIFSLILSLKIENFSVTFNVRFIFSWKLYTMFRSSSSFLHWPVILLKWLVNRIKKIHCGIQSCSLILHTTAHSHGLHIKALLTSLNMHSLTLPLSVDKNSPWGMNRYFIKAHQLINESFTLTDKQVLFAILPLGRRGASPDNEGKQSAPQLQEPSCWCCYQMWVSTSACRTLGQDEKEAPAARCRHELQR